MTESNDKAKHKICLSGGHEEALLDHFAKAGARCLVWSALGINLLHESPALLGHPSLQQASLPPHWPAVVVVCMKYNVRRVAQELRNQGAPIVIGIPIDLCSQVGHEFGHEFCKVLVCFLVALVGHERLTSEIIQKETDLYNAMGGGFQQQLDTLGDGLKIEPFIPPKFVEATCHTYHDHGPWPIEISPGHDQLPQHNEWFTDKQFTDLHLKLRSSDLKRLPEICKDLPKHRVTSLVCTDEINRARAVALEVCRHHLYQAHYLGGIYWVATEEQLAELDAMQHNCRMLVWFDMHTTTATMDDLFKAIKESLEWGDDKLAEFVARLETEDVNAMPKVIDQCHE